MAPKEGYLGSFGRIVSTFAGGDPDGARHVWQGIGPWLQQLGLAATSRWLPYLVLGIPCEVQEHGQPQGPGQRCPSAAVQACTACHKPCCVDHAFVAGDGSAVCYVCVHRVVKESQPKIPGADRSAGHTNSRSNGRPPPPPPPGAQGQPRTSPGPSAEAYAEARRVLGIERGASRSVVERQYRILLARWHPDKFRDPTAQADASVRFKEVRAAYDLLRDHPE
jgi:hypothetical protein